MLFTKSKITQSTLSLRQIPFGPSLSVRPRAIKKRGATLYVRFTKVSVYYKRVLYYYYFAHSFLF